MSASSNASAVTAAAPIASVIIPTYRRPHLLPRAVNSVLAQTFPDFELIIVDDASPDATPDVIAAMTDPRIRPIRLETNRGVSVALNTGVQQARGDFLAFVGDDDRVEPEFLAELVSALQAAPPTVGFGWTWKRVVKLTPLGELEVGHKTFGGEMPMPLSGRRLLHNPEGGNNGLIIRRSVFFQAGGFDPLFSAAEDTDLLVRLAPYYDYLIVPKLLYVATNLDEPQLTGFSIKRGRSLELLADRHAGTVAPRVVRRWYLGSARNFYFCDEVREGRRIMWKLIKRRPWQPAYYIWWLLFENRRHLSAAWRRRVFPPHRG